mgnify:CR=1 FL=1
MTKFILFMWLCSSVAGNSCKLIPTPIQNFETYRECAIYGYEYSFNMLKDFKAEAVNEYKMYTAFNCKESQSI